ncbi:hypothetical protein BC937DRAFT_89984 [Endogone sp. FLAS-F59071]|nr:hypothetical protein BC937DRAFT_89984 [Endogone sp. FLAS-F59071]|eukprot:RUS17435.1 hypothetical protein BC937DRAFT_89984 [Endogone sp. FLAS-F59071]
MGFDAIYISPIPENAADGYHGYWATDFYSVNSNFGTASDLQALVKAAHDLSTWRLIINCCYCMYGITQVTCIHLPPLYICYILGMYVMLDTVANHAGPTVNGDYSGYTFNSSSLYHPQCDIDYTNQTSIEQCWVANNLPDIGKSSHYLNSCPCFE